MQTYYVLNHLVHDKKAYEIGSTIDLEEDMAAPLLEAKVLSLDPEEKRVVNPTMMDAEPTSAGLPIVGGEVNTTGEPSFDGPAPAPAEEVTPPLDTDTPPAPVQEEEKPAPVGEKPRRRGSQSRTAAKEPEHDPSANL